MCAGLLRWCESITNIHCHVRMISRSSFQEQGKMWRSLEIHFARFYSCCLSPWPQVLFLHLVILVRSFGLCP